MNENFNKFTDEQLTAYLDGEFEHTAALEIERALNRWDLHPSRLELDVTEDIFVDGDEAGLDDLHKLKTLGVAISLDNFGTGNSSM